MSLLEVVKADHYDVVAANDQPYVWNAKTEYVISASDGRRLSERFTTEQAAQQYLADHSRWLGGWAVRPVPAGRFIDRPASRKEVNAEQVRRMMNSLASSPMIVEVERGAALAKPNAAAMHGYLQFSYGYTGSWPRVRFYARNAEEVTQMPDFAELMNRFLAANPQFTAWMPEFDGVGYQIKIS